MAGFQERVRRLRKQRDEQIRKLHEQGWTYEEIAEAMSLSRQRIGQILTGPGRKPGGSEITRAAAR